MREGYKRDSANSRLGLIATFCSELKQVCPPFMPLLVYLVLFTSSTASLVAGNNGGDQEASCRLATTFLPKGP